jgi:hypothetical protein
MTETAVKTGLELLVHIGRETTWLIERHTTGGKLKIAQKSLDGIQALFKEHATILTLPEKMNIEDYIKGSVFPPSHIDTTELTSEFVRAVRRKEKLRLENGWWLSVRRDAKVFANEMETQLEWVQVSHNLSSS